MVARALAVAFAASLLFFVVNVLGQVRTQDDASLVGRVPAMILVIAIPGGLAASLLWWAWRGWQLSPEPRWIVAIRWGMVGSSLWTVCGVFGVLAWFSLVEHRDAGLMPIMAFLTAPVGFVIGAIAGVVRGRRG